MDFSRDWIGQYVELPALDELTAGLTEVGLAVEGTTEVGEDVVLDVDVTTNRPDCMCHLGLAREVAVRFDTPLRVPSIELEEGEASTADAIQVTLDDGEGCPRYVARVVRGVKVGPSPGWLRTALESIGQRSINNVVDITNFVLWESGQPVHAFDLHKIAGAEIIVRRAHAGEPLVTLDGEERKLEPEILVIADRERAVALAGIMGGLDSEVTEATADVLIECAHFDPTLVRTGAGRLAMHTDANHRFERGADPEGPLWATDRVASLIAEVAGGEVLAGAVDTRSEHLPTPLEGRLDYRRLKAFGGVEIAPDEVARIMTGLGFELALDEGAWQVTVPSWRYYDMKYTRPDGTVYEADLFEESLRHVGFENIPSALPPVESPDEGSSDSYDQRRRMRAYLAASGLAETISYAFHGTPDDGVYGIWCEGEPVRVANPLSELYNVMRRSLASGLVESAQFNMRRGAEAVRLFESGHLFPGPDQAEVETVAVLIGGLPGQPWEQPKELDLFDLKGTFEGLAAHFGTAIRAEASELAGVVSGTGATLLAPGREEPVGWMGRLNLTDAPYPVFAGELDVSVLAEGDRFSTVTPPSRLPGVAVDLTLTHDRQVAWREIESAIASSSVEDLTGFGLKDRYAGQGVPAGAVNTTIYFVYNAPDRSLTQDEVNNRQQALTDALQSRFGWQEA